MYTCLIFNIIIIIAFICELWNDYIAIFENGAKLKTKKKYIVRIAVMIIITIGALLILYDRFGINQGNLTEYLYYGAVNRR